MAVEEVEGGGVAAENVVVAVDVEHAVVEVCGESNRRGLEEDGLEMPMVSPVLSDDVESVKNL